MMHGQRNVKLFSPYRMDVVSK